MNEQLIEEFCTYLSSEGLSKNRIKKYFYTLRTISGLIKKPFQDCTKEDLIHFLAKIQDDKIKSKQKETAYAEETKRDFKIVVKRLWRFLGKEELISWIKTTQNKRLQKLIRTKDVLTEEEVYKMIDNATHSRDKAIISLLFESGSRIGEIEKLKIGDIVFDDKGYNFMTNGKTGDVYKRVVNTKAVELLRNWIKQHPLKNEADSPLWITLARSHTGLKQMKQAGFRKMLSEIAEISGIKKRVNPHSFRHAKITDLRINKKVPDAIIEMLVGWKAGSNMFEIYQHGKSEDIDKALVEVYGLKEEQKKRKMIETFDNLLANDSDFRLKIAKLLNEKGVKL